MNREDILAVLRGFKRECAEEYSILAIGIFGSFARDEATENSDVDIVFETNNPNLFRTARLKQALESRLARHVDLVRWRESLNSRLKTSIARDARYV
ncbi:MAG: nucleotidyltransferase domain-containing protein [Acidobacteriota bacterium]|nr:nucleotidyltransferase domain-containing protein [Acidobacteriota bacterium]